MLLDFWNNYLPPSLHQRIVSDYLNMIVLPFVPSLSLRK